MLNYNTYKQEKFICPKCKWTGLGSEMFLGTISEFHTLRDLECPKCETTVGVLDLSCSKESTSNNNQCPPPEKNLEELLLLKIKKLQDELDYWEQKFEPTGNMGNYGKQVRIESINKKLVELRNGKNIDIGGLSYDDFI